MGLWTIHYGEQCRGEGRDTRDHSGRRSELLTRASSHVLPISQHAAEQVKKQNLRARMTILCCLEHRARSRDGIWRAVVINIHLSYYVVRN